MWFIKSLVFCLLILSAWGCKKGSSTTTSSNDSSNVSNTSFAKGADISWVTQMEQSGNKFYDGNGVQTDCFQLMKDVGINAIRLRVWVNPIGGWCDSADVLTKATRAKTLGLKIMLDFHYSDTWADPGHQTKPAAWTGLSTIDLISEVYAHTFNVLTYLKANGITAEWVQVGNETSNGMLWNDGMANLHMSTFAQMITSGYNAVKAVDTTTKVIVHLNNGFDNNLYRWMFDSLQVYNARWDIIGMSLYPNTNNWQSLDNECLTNMNDMVSRYNKQVMICEVGMSVDSPAYCKAFLTDIITKVRSVNGNNGLGVFYWEPESYNWQGYGLGAFDNTGKPTIAMEAFAN